MCGIAGIVYEAERRISPRVVGAMNASMRHRGPDDEGYVLIDHASRRFRCLAGPDSPPAIQETLAPIGEAEAGSETIALMQRRFSIIDLSPLGHQPMFDVDHACCVVFNGEIYNYLELRHQLAQRGHSFRSATDTEVILEAYKAWGADCFSRFNGMWALALYDFRVGRLILSRDRVGKKPLYWSRRNGVLCFASEIRALFAEPEIARHKAVDESSIHPYLAFGRRDVAHATFFAGVESFPPGTWAVANGDFPSTGRAYWTLPSERLTEKDVSVDEAVNAIRETLADAVRLRVRADVPWGVELSGGIDSSSVVATASMVGISRLNTYTVRFPDSEWNEEPFARSVARRYDTAYHVLESPIDNFWEEIRPFTWLEEEPYHSPNLHSIQMQRRLMRAHGIKMLLSGSAGDELFAGYAGSFPYAQADNLRAGRWGQFARNALRWSQGVNLHDALLAPATSLIKHELKKRFPATRRWQKAFSYILAPEGAGFGSFGSLSDRLFQDMTSLLMPYWLRAGDKTHMGIPIEPRAPLLDYRMVELAFTLPTTYLVRDGWHKWILRKAMEDRLPDDVLWRRRKMGFPFPIKRFLASSADAVRVILREARNPYVDISRCEDAHTNWRLISFLLWYELFMRDNDALFSALQAQCRVPDAQRDSQGFMPEFKSTFAAIHG